MCLVRWQAVELIDHLFDLAQVQQLAGAARKAHGQLTRGKLAAFCRLQAFETALHHDDLQAAVGQVLLGQVGTAGDQAFLNIKIGNALEQRVQLRDAQALAKIGFEQALAFRRGERISTLQHDIADRKTAAVIGFDRRDRLGAPAR